MSFPRRTVLRAAVLALALLPVLAVSVASAFVELRHRWRIHPVQEVPRAPVAIIFGAGLSAGGEPSPILRQRVETGMALYRAGKVRKLLVTGDNTDRFHDETKAMRRYAIDRGVPAGDVVGDYAGVSTWDSCFRAREIFGVDRAVLVTQSFHLPRALYMANSLGIDADGVAADGAGPRVGGYRMREFLARAQAVWTVAQRPPARILGAREPIDLHGQGAPQVTAVD